MIAVSLKNVSKTFGRIKALDNLSFEVRGGELFVILGPSGCGKTTTLRILAGLEQPDIGQVVIDSNVVSNPKVLVPPNRRNIGMVFQDLALWPHMTVAGNLNFALSSREISVSERSHKILKTLRLVNLEKKKGFYPHHLSGGEMQRVALGRALILEPNLLLLDEPLANLEENLRERLKDEIVRLHREAKLTTIYVTHSQDEALAIADKILIMNEGKVEQIDSPQNIYKYPHNLFVASFIGMSNILKGEVVGKNKVKTILGDFDCKVSDNAKQVHLLIRPEDIKISDERGIRGKVTEGTYRGNFWLWRIDVSGEVITVQSNNLLQKDSTIGLIVPSKPYVIEETK